MAAHSALLRQSRSSISTSPVYLALLVSVSAVLLGGNLRKKLVYSAPSLSDGGFALMRQSTVTPAIADRSEGPLFSFFHFSSFFHFFIFSCFSFFFFTFFFIFLFFFIFSFFIFSFFFQFFFPFSIFLHFFSFFQFVSFFLSFFHFSFSCFSSPGLPWPPPRPHPKHRFLLRRSWF